MTKDYMLSLRIPGDVFDALTAYKKIISDRHDYPYSVSAIARVLLESSLHRVKQLQRKPLLTRAKYNPQQPSRGHLLREVERLRRQLDNTQGNPQ